MYDTRYCRLTGYGIRRDVIVYANRFIFMFLAHWKPRQIRCLFVSSANKNGAGPCRVLASKVPRCLSSESEAKGVPFSQRPVALRGNFAMSFARGHERPVCPKTSPIAVIQRITGKRCYYGIVHIICANVRFGSKTARPGSDAHLLLCVARSGRCRVQAVHDGQPPSEERTCRRGPQACTGKTA